MEILLHNAVEKQVYYRPRSEASEGYVFTVVCHSVIFGGGRGCCNLGHGHNTPSPGSWPQHPVPPQLRSMGGRYASYWNAFLFFIISPKNSKQGISGAFPLHTDQNVLTFMIWAENFQNIKQPIVWPIFPKNCMKMKKGPMTAIWIANEEINKIRSEITIRISAEY